MAQSRMTVGLMDADALNPWISRRLSRSDADGAGRSAAKAKAAASAAKNTKNRRSPRGGGTATAISAEPTVEIDESPQNVAPSAALEKVGLELSTLETSVERLVVVGEGPRAEQAFQRSTLDSVWHALDEVDVDIVVFDAGSMMDAALSVRLCQQVDVVVLIVPLARQNVDQLRVVKRLFDGRSVEILPVVTDVVARRQLG